MDYSKADLFRDAVQVFSVGKHDTLTEAVYAVLAAKRYIINDINLSQVFNADNAIPEPETATPDKRLKPEPETTTPDKR